MSVKDSSSTSHTSSSPECTTHSFTGRVCTLKGCQICFLGRSRTKRDERVQTELKLCSAQAGEGLILL